MRLLSVKISEEKLYIATVGSKMRVCLPPNASNHIGIEKGDYVTLIPDEYEGIPFLRMHPVKKDNFKISDGKKAEIVNNNKKYNKSKKQSTT